MIIDNRQYWNLIRSIGGLRFRQDTEWEEYFGCRIIGLPDQSRWLIFDNPKHETMFKLKYEDAMNQDAIRYI